jgi:ribonuclease HII
VSSRARTFANLSQERRAWQAGYELVAGVDEAGRGAWAGPLVAAALILPRDGAGRARLTRLLNARSVPQPLRDSKQLTALARERALDAIQEAGVAYAVAAVEPAAVDELGVGVANRAALATALARLTPAPDFALIDAFIPLDPPCRFQAVVGGDSSCVAIALASIVAKVERDRLMAQLDRLHPGYGFAVHKGYGTAGHAAAIERLGVSPQHRRSYAPVAEALARVPHAD